MASYTCNCFANKYFCCFTNLGCYYYPEGYICPYTTVLSPTPICTCFPNRLVCCYNSGCYYKEPYDCVNPTASTTIKIVGSPTCSCFPNRYACGNGDLIFSMPETTSCYKSSSSNTPVCSCFPNKAEICCDESTLNKCTENLVCSSTSSSKSTSTTYTTTSTSTSIPTPTPHPSPTPPTPTQSSSDSNVTAIVCGVVIPIVVILLIFIILWIYLKRRKVLNERRKNEKFIVDPNHRVGEENINKSNVDNQVKEKIQFIAKAEEVEKGEDVKVKNQNQNYERHEIDINNKSKVLNLEEEEPSVPKSRVSLNKPEVNVFPELKVETKQKEEIDDDALVVKREKERKEKFVLTEEPDEIQKGFGLKENIMSESEIKIQEEGKQED